MRNPLPQENNDYEDCFYRPPTISYGKNKKKNTCPNNVEKDTALYYGSKARIASAFLCYFAFSLCISHTKLMKK